MVGYKSKEYLDFGWASARVDDIVNWLPARLTGVVMLVVNRPVTGSFQSAWTVLRRDAKKHPSPNSGWGEAAVAALLGVRLGGLNYYKGKKSYRMEMGNPVNELQLKHISGSIRIMQRTITFFILILILGGLFLEFAITRS